MSNIKGINPLLRQNGGASRQGIVIPIGPLYPALAGRGTFRPKEFEPLKVASFKLGVLKFIRRLSFDICHCFYNITFSPLTIFGEILLYTSSPSTTDACLPVGRDRHGFNYANLRV